MKDLLSLLVFLCLFVSILMLDTRMKAHQQKSREAVKTREIQYEKIGKILRIYFCFRALKELFV